MKTLWSQHLKDPEKKEEFEKLLRNSTVSLGRLRDIVRELQTGLLQTERSNKVYESPNWTYLQAHTNGMLQAYGNIDRLLSFIDEEQKDGRTRNRKPVRQK